MNPNKKKSIKSVHDVVKLDAQKTTLDEIFARVCTIFYEKTTICSIVSR